MKITRLGPSRPLLTVGGALTGGIGGGGTGAPPGQVPTSIGSNGSIAFGSNVGVITVNGTTQVLGPYVNFANGSNTTVTVDMVGATGSNTIRVHATGGGSVSFGSNSTRVSEVPAVGASTDSAKADHIHDGIGTITASSSNTLQRGTVNLRPGSNVSFGLTDSDGDGEFDTLTINGAAAGGGGSSGITVQDEGTPLATAATTLDFVGAGVTATGSGATKTITIPGGGGGGGAVAFPLDVEPVSPDADDDEFNTGSLSGAWTDPVTSAAGQTNTIVVQNSWLYLEPATAGSSSTGKHVFGIRKASPSGSFTAAAKLAIGTPGSDMRPGLYVGAAGARGHVIGPFAQDNQPGYLGVTTTSNTADWSGYDGTLSTFSLTVPGSYTDLLWVRFRWDAGATTLYMDISMNGVMWRQVHSRAGMAQPDQMGVVLFSNGGTVQADAMVACDWFRVIDGSAAFTPY